MPAENARRRATPERIAELRRQIAEGGYDTPERLEAAVDAMFERVFAVATPEDTAPPRGDS